jgi:folate-dependent tRNA-U54 methylase TrmFO/GidA
VTHADPGHYQPANIAFDLLPPVEGLPRAVARDRQARRARQCDRALADLKIWLAGMADRTIAKTGVSVAAMSSSPPAV